MRTYISIALFCILSVSALDNCNVGQCTLALTSLSKNQACLACKCKLQACDNPPSQPCDIDTLLHCAESIDGLSKNQACLACKCKLQPCDNPPSQPCDVDTLIHCAESIDGAIAACSGCQEEIVGLICEKYPDTPCICLPPQDWCPDLWPIFNYLIVIHPLKNWSDTLCC